MNDNVGESWKRNEPDSPCEKICLIHPDAGICIGCYRTADEIAGWAKMEQGERLALKDSLAGRAPRLKGKRRGRAGRLGQKVPKL